ncbi:hypothetical protein E4U56_006400 [Claviceps arundinis]|uniref:Uncharacterized protein n=1 Tax=Claviceps arundinis TaxID=1623583 RepID=A0A9P7MLW4_9HYPO|nr:hypothetical protein E4U56_006400 [Claviceps arundinis]
MTLEWQQDEAARAQVKYLRKDMLPAHMSRFAGYITKDWEKARDDIPEHSPTIDIDNKIAYLYSFYVEQAKTFERLRRTFCEDFEYWTLQMWEKASSRTRQEMRDLLQDNGIDVGNASGRNMIASELHHVVMRCIHGDSQQQEEPQKPENELPFNERVDLMTEDSNSHAAVEANQPLQYQIYRQQTEVADTTAKLEAAQLATRQLKQQSSVDSIDEDLSVDFCEGSGSHDTFPDDPVKQKGKEEETLPEGFTSCERTHSQESLELSPLKVLAVSRFREIVATTDFAMSWKALLITTPLISLLRDFVSHYRLVARLIP